MADLDLMTKSLEKSIKSANAAKKAQMDFQMDLTLSKIKQQQEIQNQRTKMQYDLMAEKAKKALMSPLEQIQMDQYQREQGQGTAQPQAQPNLGIPDPEGYIPPEAPWGQGNPMIPNERPAQPVTAPLKIEGGKFKRMGLKDMAEQVYMKPQETWTQRDKQIVAQYSQMMQANRSQKNSSTESLADLLNSNGESSTTKTSPNNNDLDSFLSQF